MINRLVYEVRLRPLKRENRSKLHKKWRWDCSAYITTDPEYPGVETGRQHIGGVWGYERFKYQALKNIADFMADNPHKAKYEEL